MLRQAGIALALIASVGAIERLIEARQRPSGSAAPSPMHAPIGQSTAVFFDRKQVDVGARDVRELRRVADDALRDARLAILVQCFAGEESDLAENLRVASARASAVAAALVAGGVDRTRIVIAAAEAPAEHEHSGSCAVETVSRDGAARQLASLQVAREPGNSHERLVGKSRRFE